MKLFIGLGNPGEKYKNNRHNVGHMVIDQLKIKNLKFKIYKSDKFMNDSGSFVLAQCKKNNINYNDLYIIHDDLDIKIGEYKIQFGKGPKGHNGLIDIDQKLGTNEYWHVRVGVDNRDTENRTNGEEYVLQDFIKEEKVILDSVIKQICNQLAR